MQEHTGKKYDDGKPRWDLLPFDAAEEVVKVLTAGADKYGENNWRNFGREAKNRYFAAALRHMSAWRRGEKNDPETGRSHLAHAICGLMFALVLDGKK